jgi:hypothetical protein
MDRPRMIPPMPRWLPFEERKWGKNGASIAAESAQRSLRSDTMPLGGRFPSELLKLTKLEGY